MTHPRAADDFAVIRARLAELRRNRGQGSADEGPATDPRAGAGAGEPPSAGRRGLPPVLRRVLYRSGARLSGKGL